MKRLMVLIVLLFVLSSTYAQDLPCDKVVAYKIDATLDPSEKMITGQLELTWTNTGSKATQEMLFHLYWNAFKNSQSTFFKEGSPFDEYTTKLISRFEKGGWGFCDVKSISAQSDGLFDAIELSPTFIQPDDNDADDETVCQIDLPKAVAPGQSVQLKIDFKSQVPHRAPRTGHSGDYYFIAQWFPKIGVWFEDEWNCHQFHRTSEFFADYGDYDVRLTVPSEYVVGASGVRTDSTQNSDGTTTYRYEEQCIHDFAWTAYPDYKVAVRQFEHPELPAVEMRLLYQPEHKKYVDTFFDATENTLKYLGTWYVPYPYSNITIVDAAWKSGASGMEYPTLFTTGVDLFVSEGSQRPRGLTVHECAHQFFYGILGSNEFENAWMDEGFTVYATARCMDTAYGPGAFSKSYLQRDGFDIPWTFQHAVKDQRDWTVENHCQRGALDAMDRCSWDYVTYEAYRNNAYEKPALMLWTLEGLLGETLFSEIMKTYATRFAFKHPKPQDFFNVVNEFAPENMDWFFDQVMKTPATVDYAVTKIESTPGRAVKGLFGSGDDMVEKDEPADNTILSQVHIKRLGEMIMPVDILITFEDGETELIEWDGATRLNVLRFSRSVAVEKVEVDPYQKIWLDTNPGNNSKYKEPQSFLAFRWGAAWLFWLQDMLELVAIFS
jgi:hypothetical protein